jgi:hypothetical protein
MSHYTVSLSEDDLKVLVSVLKSELKTFDSLPHENLEEIEGAPEMRAKLQVLSCYFQSVPVVLTPVD